jgi:hypothetical protein
MGISSSARQVRGLLTGLFDGAKDLTYASAGIVGAVGEEFGGVYRRSIQRGKGRIKKLEERLPLSGRLKQTPESIKAAEPAARHGVGQVGRLPHSAANEWRTVLNPLQLADSTDLAQLTSAIEELDAKLDRLEKER